MDTSYSQFLSEVKYPISNAEITLTKTELWHRFDHLENEMIITKSGRRLFPTIEIFARNLDPEAKYSMFIEMELAANCRFKYASSVGWSPAGNEEAQSPHLLYKHPDSPATGERWMCQAISFARLKLTNTSVPPKGQLVLSSMHRYQPKVLIVRTEFPDDVRKWGPRKQFVFRETQFVAVTAYQNKNITKLKVENNQFAKGFREDGKSYRKRKNRSSESSVNSATSATSEEQEEIIDVEKMDEPRPQKRRSVSPKALVNHPALAYTNAMVKPVAYLAPPVMPVQYNYAYYMPPAHQYHRHPFYAQNLYPPVPAYCYLQQQPIQLQRPELMPIAHVGWDAPRYEAQEEEDMIKEFTDFSIRSIIRHSKGRRLRKISD